MDGRLVINDGIVLLYVIGGTSGMGRFEWAHVQ
jgi:hypothetical protein